MQDLRKILESLVSGVVVVSNDGDVAFVNPAFLLYSGLDSEALLGRPFSELAIALQERFGPRAAPALDQAGASRDVEWRSSDGVMYLREDSSILQDADGSCQGTLLVYHDMRREKAIDRMKSEFISVASHELRTPMTSIKGSVDLILSGFAGDISTDTQELLEIAQKNCDRLVRLINDILDLAKIEAGQIKLKRGPLDMKEAAHRAIRGVKALADQNTVSLLVDSPGQLPPIEADRDRIDQVLTNLLSNAIKFSPPKGQVRIHISRVDEWVETAVIDQGCGISEADLPKVFGKFQQVGESSSKGGTGLGLAIAQALVNEHGGKIWLESKENVGTRFIFRLPVLVARAATQ